MGTLKTKQFVRKAHLMILIHYESFQHSYGCHKFKFSRNRWQILQKMYPLYYFSNAFHSETNHLICNANKMNTGLKQMFLKIYY